MEIINLDSIDSTNNYLKLHLQDYSDRDVAVFADEQTAGRGNASNSWHSAKGQNLTFSVLIHPQRIAPIDSFVLSQSMALAIVDALSSAYLPKEKIRVKWPNDIYILPEGLKLSGTLIETTIAKGQLQTAIIGVGLNVNETSFPTSLPNPVSMAQIAGHKFNLNEVAESMIKAFSRYYAMAQKQQYDEIRAQYHSNLYLLNQESEFIDKHETFKAKIKGVTSNGQLLLVDSTGRQRQYEFKEIIFK